MADPYGLPAAIDPVASTDPLLQICPLLAALLGLPPAAMAYRGHVRAAGDRPAVVFLRAGVAAAVIAALFLLATVLAGFAAGGAPTGFSGAPPASCWAMPWICGCSRCSACSSMHSRARCGCPF